MAEKYTLVQHSGYGYGQKPGFEKGLEVRSLTSQKEINLVKKVGGMLFDTYAEASEAEMRMQYPPGHLPNNFYPGFLGSFSDKEIDGLKIAITLRGQGGVTPF